MGRDALQRLFSILGGFLAFYSVSVWSLSQGGNAISAVPGLDPRTPAGSAYYAVIIIGALLFLACLVAIAFSRAERDTTQWRFPVFGLGDAKVEAPNAWSMRLYVAFLFIVTLLVPAASLVHLNRKLADGIVWNEALPASATTNVACAMPRFWPFGSCADRENSLAILEAVEIENGKAGADRARTWLANHACDIHWHLGMAGPQVEQRTKNNGRVLSQAEDNARNWLALQGGDREKKLRAVTGLQAGATPAPVSPEFCAGPRDRSDICRKDEDCRGDQWLPLVSLLLVVLTTLAAWGALLWLVAVEWLRPDLRRHNFADGRNG